MTSKHYVKIILLSAPLSFFMGLLWIVALDGFSADDFSARPLVTLTVPEGYYGSSFAKSLEKASHAKIILKKYNSSEALKEALKKGTDLILIPSELSRSALASKWLQPLPEEIKEEIETHTHVDFRRPKFDPEHQHLAPFSWGVHGYWKKSSSVNNLTELLKTKSSSVIFSDSFIEKHLITKNLLEPLKLKGRFHQFGNFASLYSEKDLLVIQAPFTRKPPKGSGTWNYWLPEEGASLWIHSIGFPLETSVSRAAKNVALSLFSEDFLKLYGKHSMSGFTHLRADTLSDVPEEKKPKHLRSLRLKNLKMHDVSYSKIH